MTQPAEPLSYARPGVDSRILFTKEGDRATVVIHRPGRRAKKAAGSSPATSPRSEPGAGWLPC
jgi:hypothetical protein